MQNLWFSSLFGGTPGFLAYVFHIRNTIFAKLGREMAVRCKHPGMGSVPHGGRDISFNYTFKDRVRSNRWNIDFEFEKFPEAPGM
jgi:hypothetical protein